MMIAGYSIGQFTDQCSLYFMVCRTLQYGLGSFTMAHEFFLVAFHGAQNTSHSTLTLQRHEAHWAIATSHSKVHIVLLDSQDAAVWSR
jgi:hypothetical protein